MGKKITLVKFNFVEKKKGGVQNTCISGGKNIVKFNFVEKKGGATGKRGVQMSLVFGTHQKNTKDCTSGTRDS